MLINFINEQRINRSNDLISFSGQEPFKNSKSNSGKIILLIASNFWLIFRGESIILLISFWILFRRSLECRFLLSLCVDMGAPKYWIASSSGWFGISSFWILRL